jgi:hypothetical protein
MLRRSASHARRGVAAASVPLQHRTTLSLSLSLAQRSRGYRTVPRAVASRSPEAAGFLQRGDVSETGGSDTFAVNHSEKQV